MTRGTLPGPESSFAPHLSVQRPAHLSERQKHPHTDSVLRIPVCDS